METMANPGEWDEDYTMSKDFIPGRYGDTGHYINAYGFVMNREDWEKYVAERRADFRALAERSRRARERKEAQVKTINYGLQMTMRKCQNVCK